MDLSQNAPDSEFRDRVYSLVAQIPPGRVMSYGQIAALCGSPRAARNVGQIAHWGPTDLPWQRVVNKQGGLAGGYSYGGREGQRRALEAEGVAVNQDLQVDVGRLLWWPPDTTPPTIKEINFGEE
jgi:methylated-DNA-protein-cysteine methyltransferase related protein